MYQAMEIGVCNNNRKSRCEGIRWNCVIKTAITLCLGLFILVVLVIGYLCPEGICTLKQWSISESRHHSWDKLNLRHVNDNSASVTLSHSIHPILHNKLSFDDMFNDDSFDIEGNDVMVFLHMQKTGGTSFGRHLVRNLDLEKPCFCKRGVKRCKCIRPNSNQKLWLFSRYSTGWKCGLHADWTELTSCVDEAMDKIEGESTKRRYFFITFLREPVARFLSEYRHVQRGATWKASRHFCGGRTPTPEEMPSCYNGSDWTEVTIEKFIACNHNLAINRQTRMLADLTLVGCYNKSILSPQERDIILLASAKENLRRMAFFGLCEYQKTSQYLFEKTFHLYFIQPFVQLNETYSTLTLATLKSETVQKIKDLNHLDIELYAYAKQLLEERQAKLKKREEDTNNNLIT